MPFDATPLISPDRNALNALIRARQQIAFRGWIQKQAESRFGYCMVGAISRLGLDHDTKTAAFQYLAYALGFSDITGIVSWNDCAGRTKEEVLATFDCAIRLAFLS